jgi:signal transduction histidine kinase
MWSRGPKLLEVATLTVIVVAVAAELVILLRTPPPAGSWIALALTAAGVGIGYRHPHVGLVMVAASPLTATLSGAEPIFFWSIACFAAFLFTLRGLPGLLTGVVIGAANLTAAGLASGSIAPSVDPGASIGAFVALVASAAGSAIVGHRKYWFELEQRTREAIATREAAVNRSVAEERVRIARDLHDSVGHKIAVVSMHLGAAEVHLPPDARAARADLESARAGVQSVLRETQQILRVLRVGADGGALAPTPQHGHIPDLVESYRAAGLTIEASLPDLSRPLGPSTSAAAFRITQEALTNAQRHGTGAVSLHIEITDESAVVIEVVNVRRPTAAGRETSNGGQGLVGMRERAESAGGHLDVRIDEKLFWVRAELAANEEVDT